MKKTVYGTKERTWWGGWRETGKTYKSMAEATKQATIQNDKRIKKEAAKVAKQNKRAKTNRKRVATGLKRLWGGVKKAASFTGLALRTANQALKTSLKGISRGVHSMGEGIERSRQRAEDRAKAKPPLPAIKRSRPAGKKDGATALNKGLKKETDWLKRESTALKKGDALPTPMPQTVKPPKSFSPLLDQRDAIARDRAESWDIDAMVREAKGRTATQTTVVKHARTGTKGVQEHQRKLTEGERRKSQMDEIIKAGKSSQKPKIDAESLVKTVLPDHLERARDWLSDCYPDDRDEIYAMSPREVICTTNKYHAEGWGSFEDTAKADDEAFERQQARSLPDLKQMDWKLMGEDGRSLEEIQASAERLKKQVAQETAAIKSGKSVSLKNKDLSIKQQALQGKIKGVKDSTKAIKETKQSPTWLDRPLSPSPSQHLRRNEDGLKFAYQKPHANEKEQP